MEHGLKNVSVYPFNEFMHIALYLKIVTNATIKDFTLVAVWRGVRIIASNVRFHQINAHQCALSLHSESNVTIQDCSFYGNQESDSPITLKSSTIVH